MIQGLFCFVSYFAWSFILMEVMSVSFLQIHLLGSKIFVYTAELFYIGDQILIMACLSQSFLFGALFSVANVCSGLVFMCGEKTKDFVHTTFQHNFSFFHQGQGGDVPVFF